VQAPETVFAIQNSLKVMLKTLKKLKLIMPIYTPTVSSKIYLFVTLVDSIKFNQAA